MLSGAKIPPTLLARKLSVVTGVAGAGVFIATSSPIVYVTSYLYDSGVVTVYLSDTSDGPVFRTLGALILLLSGVRFATDHLASRALVGIAGLLAIALTVIDAQAIWNGVDTRMAGTGMTVTFTALLPLMGALGATAILGSCFTGNQARESHPRER